MNRFLQRSCHSWIGFSRDDVLPSSSMNLVYVKELLHCMRAWFEALRATIVFEEVSHGFVWLSTSSSSGGDLAFFSIPLQRLVVLAPPDACLDWFYSCLMQRSGKTFEDIYLTGSPDVLRVQGTWLRSCSRAFCVMFPLCLVLDVAPRSVLYRGGDLLPLRDQGGTICASRLQNEPSTVAGVLRTNRAPLYTVQESCWHCSLMRLGQIARSW